jgi:subtilisin family serine protease
MTVRQRSSASVPRSQRPLRIAVAGPFIKSPEAFATAFTQFAAQHGVGGRIVTSQQSVFSSIAELLPIDAPNFNRDSRDGVEADLLRWFRKAMSLQPDVVVLDYGADRVLRGQGPVIEGLAASALMIAPAGNGGPSKQVHYPARLRNVLAVGALADDDTRADYSSIDRLKLKPELHALGKLDDTALASALTEKNLQGTSFSALRVAAAAALVWSQHPTSDRLKVREMLIDSARSLSDGIRALDIRKALQMARSEAALDAIRRNALTYPELHASLGLSAAALEPLMDELVKEKKVSVRHDSGVVRYCLEGSKD